VPPWLPAASAKRHLGRFRQAGDRQQRGRHDQLGRTNQIQDDGQFSRTKLDPQVNDGQDETDTAQQIEIEGPQGIRLCLRRIWIADQKIRAQRGQFPEKVNPDQVIAEHDAIHRGQEGKQQGQEFLNPLRLLGMMVVVLVHVGHTVHDDQAAHN